MFKKIIFVFSIVLIMASMTVTASTFDYEGGFEGELNQAPEFEAMVEQGELPPVEERLPVREDMYVVEPNEEIGTYGGTLDVLAMDIVGWGDDVMFTNERGLVLPAPDASGYRKHLAKDIEISEDMTTYTFELREGMKWSDGETFTADDFMFWYNHVLLNEDLTPAIGETHKAGGEVMDMVKVDDYTIEISFAKPQPYFLEAMAHSTIFYPKHYSKQFHTEFTSPEEIGYEEEGFYAWYEYFWYKHENAMGAPVTHPEQPTTGAYKLVDASSTNRIYERNPYYWKVDTAGNQLPYIEKVRGELVADTEVYEGRIISGDVDFAGWSTQARSIPMYRQYAEDVGLEVLLWEEAWASVVSYQFNMTHEDPVMREIFQDERFRKAMSLALNREEYNEMLLFGEGTPRQGGPLPDSQYYEEEFAEAYADYDPERARELLDDMGLVDKSGDGWRQDFEGNKIHITLEVETTIMPLRASMTELAIEDWADIGIDVSMDPASIDLLFERVPANLADGTVSAHRGDDLMFPADPLFLVPYNPRWTESIWPEWAHWLDSDGEQGEEPPAEIKQLREWWEQMMVEPDEEKRIELGKKLYQAQAENIWSMGTVGRPPYPVIINENLKNFPEDGYWVWPTLYIMGRDQAQLFLDE